MSNTVYVDLKYTPEPAGYTGPRWQPYTILIVSGDNQERLFKSTESYTNRGDAIHAIRLAFGDQANVYLREAEHGEILLRLATQTPKQ